MMDDIKRIDVKKQNNIIFFRLLNKSSTKHENNINYFPQSDVAFNNLVT
jgi:hypothetical protein